MNAVNNTSTLLGAAFLLQALTSLISGLILKLALTVPGNMSETMVRIANSAWLMRATILGEVVTAAGIIFLGAVLFIAMRKQNEIMALVAFGLYILEATLLAASRIEAFSLLRISQEYVASGHPASLLTTGNLAFEAMNFGYGLIMLPFCAGAILFYYLLYQSRIVPRAISLWGLLAVFPCLIATLATIYGFQPSFLFYGPYIPFEFFIGVWILIKRVKNPSPALAETGLAS